MMEVEAVAIVGAERRRHERRPHIPLHRRRPLRRADLLPSPHRPHLLQLRHGPRRRGDLPPRRLPAPQSRGRRPRREWRPPIRRHLRRVRRDGLRYGPSASASPSASRNGTASTSAPTACSSPRGRCRPSPWPSTASSTPADAVIIEAPSFPYAIRYMQTLGAQVHAVPVDGDGMDVDAVERKIDELTTAGYPRQGPSTPSPLSNCPPAPACR